MTGRYNTHIRRDEKGNKSTQGNPKPFMAHDPKGHQRSHQGSYGSRVEKFKPTDGLNLGTKNP